MTTGTGTLVPASPPPGPVSLIIESATVLDPAPQGLTVQTEQDLRVEEDRIEEIGTNLPEADRVLDGTDAIVCPGFVNAHGHAAMTLLRGYAEDLPLHEWLTQRVWPAEAHLTPQSVHAGTKLGIAEMLANGVTGFADMYLFPASVAKAAQATGIRCLAGASIADADTAEGPGEEALDRAEAFLKEHPAGDDRVAGSIAPHSAYACSGDTLDASAQIAREHEAKLQVHASETRREVYQVLDDTGRRPIQQLDEHDCLGEDTILAHGGWMTKAEAKRLARAGTLLAHCPTANMKLATGGYAPVPEVLEAGGRVAIATDGPASNNRIDPLHEAGQAALLQKHHRWEASLLPARQTLAMVTRVPAKALGFQNAGRVTEGAVADLAMVDLSRPGLQPVHDAPSQLVHAARGSDVSATIVAGEVLYERGTWPGLNVEAIIAEAQREASKLAETAPGRD